MAYRAVQMMFFGVVVIAFIQGISCLKCWNGAESLKVEFTCLIPGTTQCATYMTGTVKWYACGGCNTSLKDCKDCTGDRCNSAMAISPSFMMMILLFAISTWLLAH